MFVKPCANDFQCSFTDMNLHQVDDEFEYSGYGHCADVESTVAIQGREVFHADGFVDNAFLHFKRNYPHGNRDDDDADHDELEVQVFEENPGIEGSLGDSFRLVRVWHDLYPFIGVVYVPDSYRPNELFFQVIYKKAHGGCGHPPRSCD